MSVVPEHLRRRASVGRLYREDCSYFWWDGRDLGDDLGPMIEAGLVYAMDYQDGRFYHPTEAAEHLVGPEPVDLESLWDQQYFLMGYRPAVVLLGAPSAPPSSLTPGQFRTLYEVRDDLQWFVAHTGSFEHPSLSGPFDHASARDLARGALAGGELAVSTLMLKAHVHRRFPATRPLTV